MKNVIIEMVKKCQGGKSAVAAFLGMKECEFNNRLYQTKGQRFTEEELIAIETEYGVSDWSDELNRRLGKVSFTIPNSDELDLVELSSLQLHERAASGVFFTKLDEFVQDGVLTDSEQEILRKLLHRSQIAKAKMFESAVMIFSK